MEAIENKRSLALKLIHSLKYTGGPYTAVTGLENSKRMESTWPNNHIYFRWIRF